MSKQECVLKKTSIGGQALIEGVMMRGPQRTAMAVRHTSGEIRMEEFDNPAAKCAWIKKVPLVRGVFGMIDSLRFGYKCLMRSAELCGLEEELEDALGIKIEQAYFGLGNSETRCVKVEDLIPVKNKRTGEISKDDVIILRQLIRQVKTESCSEKVLDIYPLCYYVNGTKRLLDPVGAQGSWLKGEYMLTVGLSDQMNTFKQLHHRVGMEIQKVFVMNLCLLNSNKLYFSFSVVFYFGYAYLAIEKFVDKLKSEF